MIVFIWPVSLSLHALALTPLGLLALSPTLFLDRTLRRTPVLRGLVVTVDR